MKIIEMYGLPGGGKTTISDRLIKSLRDNGQTVGTADDYLLQCKNHRFDVLYGLFSPGGFSFFFGALKIIIKKKLLFKKNVFLNMLRILSVFYFYKQSVKKYSVIVMDQAIIQSYISAFYNHCHLENGDFGCLIKPIKTYDIIPFFVDVSQTTANERIIKRNEKNHGRCDAIGDERERLQILSIQSENFISVYKFLSNPAGKYNFVNYYLKNDKESLQRQEDENLILTDVVELQVRGSSVEQWKKNSI